LFLFAFIALVFCEDVEVSDAHAKTQHPFVLHYRLKCHTDNATYRCEGKASSNNIATRISGKGEVKTTVEKIIGSISHWKLHGVFDSKNNKGTETGEISFGVHQSHKDHSVTYIGQITSINPSTKNHKHEDYTGWMQITGGKGTMKGATGGTSQACTYEVTKDEAHCYLTGIIVLP